MNDHRWEYIVSHEAWYAAVLDDKTRGIDIRKASAEGGGVYWEFGIRWIPLFGRECPKVSIFDDAWAAFREIPEFFSGLYDMGENAQPDAVTALLDRCGFIDVTERQRSVSR